ncbi:MAG TPA: hypothetical protein VFH27_07825 [Longimicrobiaceae bacterium]|nr:hypothetical protein [Longimicrobiaceae bacterium]
MRAQRTDAEKRPPGQPAPSVPHRASNSAGAATRAYLLSPAGVLRLQRAIGNRAVGSLLHAAPVGARNAIQRFPFAFSERNGLLRLSGRQEGWYLNLYSHGIEIGYIKFSTRPDGSGGTILELKDIIVHDENMRGEGLGTVLVYLFGELAVAGGFTGVSVLTPNGRNLYARTGFVITPNQVNPNNPPDISGVPLTVRNTARGLVTGRFLIVNGPPPPVPASTQGSINDTGEGNKNIGNDQL